MNIFDCARMTASGGNMQPWQVVCMTGSAKREICEMAEQWAKDTVDTPPDDYSVYPNGLPEELLARRSALGAAFYTHIGIARDDTQARSDWSAWNYQFFGAPVGVFFIVDRRYGYGQWAHLGMFIQSVVIAADGYGLGSCIQEAWAVFRSNLHAHLKLGPDEFVYCGMALGWPDSHALVNAFQPEKRPVSGIVRFCP